MIGFNLAQIVEIVDHECVGLFFASVAGIRHPVDTFDNCTIGQVKVCDAICYSGTMLGNTLFPGDV